MDYILSPWPWYVAGPLIAFSMYLMFYFGRKFGVSSNLETVCSMVGAGRLVDYFKFDWRENKWNLTFVLGLIIGGFVANQWLSPDQVVALNPNTVSDLADIGKEHGSLEEDEHEPQRIGHRHRLGGPGRRGREAGTTMGDGDIPE